MLFECNLYVVDSYYIVHVVAELMIHLLTITSYKLQTQLINMRCIE